MELCIPPALERTAISGSIAILSIELPANSSDSLLLSWGKGENLATSPANGRMVVIQNSLVTILVTDVSETSEPAAVHVAKDMLILTLAVTFVYRNWAIKAKDSGEINNIGRSRHHGFTKNLHWQIEKVFCKANRIRSSQPRWNYSSARKMRVQVVLSGFFYIYQIFTL